MTCKHGPDCLDLECMLQEVSYEVPTPLRHSRALLNPYSEVVKVEPFSLGFPPRLVPAGNLAETRVSPAFMFKVCSLYIEEQIGRRFTIEDLSLAHTTVLMNTSASGYGMRPGDCRHTRPLPQAGGRWCPQCGALCSVDDTAADRWQVPQYAQRRGGPVASVVLDPTCYASLIVRNVSPEPAELRAELEGLRFKR